MDAPDFRINSDESIIGIEHRRLYISDSAEGRPVQATESEIEDVCAVAQELAELRGLPALQVAIFFGRLAPMDQKTRLGLARSIVNCVVRNLPGEGDRKTVQFAPSRENLLPNGVDQILISHMAGRVRNRWHEPKAGFVLRDARAAIQYAIDEKAARFPSYMEEVSECWLVLVAESLKPSGMIHPDEITLATKFRSPFARTYFMNTMDRTPARLITDQEASEALPSRDLTDRGSSQ